MRLSISLLASLGFAGSMAAQSINQFDMYSGATNFTTRAAMPGTSVGDVCQRYPSELYAAIGQYVDPVTSTLVHRVNTLYTVNQDQSGVTQEAFTVGLIAADPAGVFPTSHAPDAATDLIRTGPFNTPTSTATGAVAWIWTITLGTAYDTLPQGVDFYTACGLPANAAWVNDGMSVHMSGWVTAPTVDQPYTAGLNPIPNCVYTIDRTGAPIVAGRADRYQRIWFGTPSAVSKIGADIDPAFQIAGVPYPNYGAAGVYPDQNLTRLDGVAFKTTNANYPASFSATIGSFGGFGSPIGGFGGIDGNLVLVPFAILAPIFASGLTDGAGTLAQTTFAFPNGWAVGLGNMSFQNIIIDGVTGNLVLSNGAGFIAQ